MPPGKPLFVHRWLFLWGQLLDEMVTGWHHWLNGHEFEQTPGDSEGQGSPGMLGSWGGKESDTTEGLNNNWKSIVFYWWYHVPWFSMYLASLFVHLNEHFFLPDFMDWLLWGKTFIRDWAHGHGLGRTYVVLVLVEQLHFWGEQWQLGLWLPEPRTAGSSTSWGQAWCRPRFQGSPQGRRRHLKCDKGCWNPLWQRRLLESCRSLFPHGVELCPRRSLLILGCQPGDEIIQVKCFLHFSAVILFLCFLAGLLPFLNYTPELFQDGFCWWVLVQLDFPSGSRGKESTC